MTNEPSTGPMQDCLPFKLTAELVKRGNSGSARLDGVTLGLIESYSTRSTVEEPMLVVSIINWPGAPSTSVSGEDIDYAVPRILAVRLEPQQARLPFFNRAVLRFRGLQRTETTYEKATLRGRFYLRVYETTGPIRVLSEENPVAHATRDLVNKTVAALLSGRLSVPLATQPVPRSKRGRKAGGSARRKKTQYAERDDDTRGALDSADPYAFTTSPPTASLPATPAETLTAFADGRKKQQLKSASLLSLKRKRASGDGIHTTNNNNRRAGGGRGASAASKALFPTSKRPRRDWTQPYSTVEPESLLSREQRASLVATPLDSRPVHKASAPATSSSTATARRAVDSRATAIREDSVESDNQPPTANPTAAKVHAAVYTHDPNAKRLLIQPKHSKRVERSVSRGGHNTLVGEEGAETQRVSTSRKRRWSGDVSNACSSPSLSPIVPSDASSVAGVGAPSVLTQPNFVYGSDYDTDAVVDTPRSTPDPSSATTPRHSRPSPPPDNGQAGRAVAVLSTSDDVVKGVAVNGRVVASGTPATTTMTTTATAAAMESNVAGGDPYQPPAELDDCDGYDGIGDEWPDSIPHSQPGSRSVTGSPRQYHVESGEDAGSSLESRATGESFFTTTSTVADARRLNDSGGAASEGCRRRVTGERVDEADSGSTADSVEVAVVFPPTPSVVSAESTDAVVGSSPTTAAPNGNSEAPRRRPVRGVVLSQSSSSPSTSVATKLGSPASTATLTPVSGVVKRHRTGTGSGSSTNSSPSHGPANTRFSLNSTPLSNISSTVVARTPHKAPSLLSSHSTVSSSSGRTPVSGVVRARSGRSRDGVRRSLDFAASGGVGADDADSTTGSPTVQSQPEVKVGGAKSVSNTVRARLATVTASQPTRTARRATTRSATQLTRSRSGVHHPPTTTTATPRTARIVADVPFVAAPSPFTRALQAGKPRDDGVERSTQESDENAPPATAGGSEPLGKGSHTAPHRAPLRKATKTYTRVKPRSKLYAHKWQRTQTSARAASAYQNVGTTSSSSTASSPPPLFEIERNVC